MTGHPESVDTAVPSPRIILSDTSAHVRPTSGCQPFTGYTTGVALSPADIGSRKPAMPDDRLPSVEKLVVWTNWAPPAEGLVDRTEPRTYHFVGQVGHTSEVWSGRFVAARRAVSSIFYGQPRQNWKEHGYEFS